MGRAYAEVIGDPIAHSKSPLIHNFWLAKLGIDAEYRATRVTRDDLPAYLAARRADPAWRGCNVTMPLKTAVMRFADESEPLTQEIGAANLLHRMPGRLWASNTDWTAIASVTAPAHCEGRSATLIGTGGAARAALAGLKTLGAEFVHVMARDGDAARRLLRDLALPGDAVAIGPVPESKLVINATPLGMRGHPELFLDLSALPGDAAVLDLVYDPIETALLRAARARGLRAIDGLEVLLWQAFGSFRHLFGASPEPEHVDACRELLVA